LNQPDARAVENSLQTAGASRFGLAAADKINFFAPMIFSRRAAVTFLLAALSPLALLAANAKRAAPSRPDSTTDVGSFKGAIVTDARTGNVLFEDRADYSGPPASMTKLMTFAVLHDKLKTGGLSLSTPVKIDATDAKMAGTQVFLDPRETFPVEELIYAMMIQSANDAAHALARVAGGDSVEAFVGAMNAKARELGMTNTMFRSPHGLPPNSRRVAEGDITTPRDYALLCRHLLLNTDVLKYSSISKRDFAPERAKGAFKMENHNKLLGKVAGVDGLKTGFTDAAGYCTSVTAERNGRRVIVVIMGSLGPGGRRDLGKARDIKAIELLERGFAALPPFTTPAAKAATPATDSPIKPAPKTPSSTASAPTAPAAAESAPIKFSIPKR
jgi:D-alanyl-D-alanine carboxypeptidase